MILDRLRLPLAGSSICERIDELRCQEVVNSATDDNATVLLEVMGFGKPMDETPMLLPPGVLSLAWGQVVRQLAVGLGVDLEDVTLHEQVAQLPAHADLDIAAGPVAEGARAVISFEVRAMIDGVPRTPTRSARSGGQVMAHPDGLSGTIGSAP